MWFVTLNPLFGGMTPCQMIDLGRTAKLLKIIKICLAELPTLLVLQNARNARLSPDDELRYTKANFAWMGQ